MNLTRIVKDSFSQYGGAVLQSRALADARDCLKPSARQIFYCLYTDKFTHDKPFKKTLKAIGSAFRTYIHGDSSAEGIIMRAGQDFAMRYPLVEIEGSGGNPIESGNWSAPRYTSARLSALTEYLFKDIQKDTIEEWRDNYDDTEQYPMVLPSKGFYNIVNGSYGIGVAASSSIPQYNLREVNEALIKLLWNPEISFEEIYCVPDFATGAYLINAEEVKESHKNGQGRACKLRSKIEFDSNERALIVTEIPYMVYTNTICGQLEDIINGEDNPGIERFNDLTDTKPNIKIYLSKKANVDKVVKYLLKNTSLETHYGVNFTVLENGRFPKVFTWKQLLQAHINHEIEIYRRGFEFDLRKIEKRLHIIEGLLIALAHINEVIQVIKTSSSAADASKNLQRDFLLDEVQAKAILDMKLSRLAKLEVSKLENEKVELEKEQDKICNILKNEVLLRGEIEKGLREVAEKFGDARRTKILNIENEDDEPTEIKTLLISLTNQNNIYVAENSSLMIQRRGGVGSKFKLNQGEYVVSNIVAENTDIILFFTNKGNFYHYVAGALPLEDKVPVESLFPIREWENITALSSYNKNNNKEFIVFFTKKGYIKKSRIEEYNMKRNTALKALDLMTDDEVVSVLFLNDEPVSMLTARGQFVICETKGINPIGRVSRGVIGIKLNEGDDLTDAHIYNKLGELVVSISKEGYIKGTKINEFNIQNRGTKGTKLQKLKDDNDYLIGFQIIGREKECIITSNSARIKLNVNNVPILNKGAQGVKAIKLKEKDFIVGISKN